MAGRHCCCHKSCAESAPGDLPDGEQADDRRPLTGGRTPSAGCQSPTVGTTPHYVYTAVSRKPGMTGAEVISAVHADGHTVSDPQIRTSLSRLQERKLIVNRHKKWFLM